MKTIKKILKKEDIINNVKAKIAIIVPFRDQIKDKRKKQLKVFLEYMNKFMNRYDNWKIFVIKQTFDNKKFNRGKLLNIGYRLAYNEGYNTFIFHDVDLLPEKSVYKLYTTYPNNPIHLGSLWKEKYDYPTFLGGAISINADQYKKINGFPNVFWGWGGEDDAFYFRLMINKIPVLEPQIKDWGIIKEMKHGWDPDEGNKYKKENRNFDKKNWMKNGLNNLTFIIKKDKQYSNISKTYVHLAEFTIPEYSVDHKNYAYKKQEIKNLILFPRESYKYLKKTKQLFKNTYKFIKKYYKQGTYVYIENNKIKIYSSFNLDEENYIDKDLIERYYLKINKFLQKNNIKNLEFFINTLPFSIIPLKKNNMINVVSDVIEKDYKDIELTKLLNL